jgi:hypothetical protein
MLLQALAGSDGVPSKVDALPVDALLLLEPYCDASLREQLRKFVRHTRIRYRKLPKVVVLMVLYALACCVPKKPLGHVHCYPGFVQAASTIDAFSRLVSSAISNCDFDSVLNRASFDLCVFRTACCALLAGSLPQACV